MSWSSYFAAMASLYVTKKYAEKLDRENQERENRKRQGYITVVREYSFKEKCLLLGSMVAAITVWGLLKVEFGKQNYVGLVLGWLGTLGLAYLDYWLVNKWAEVEDVYVIPFSIFVIGISSTIWYIWV